MTRSASGRVRRRAKERDVMRCVVVPGGTYGSGSDPWRAPGDGAEGARSLRSRGCTVDPGESHRAASRTAVGSVAGVLLELRVGRDLRLRDREQDLEPRRRAS